LAKATHVSSHLLFLLTPHPPKIFRITSTGIGMTIVLFFLADILHNVCRYRNWMAIGEPESGEIGHQMVQG
jgi:hypothetical protein